MREVPVSLIVREEPGFQPGEELKSADEPDEYLGNMDGPGYKPGPELALS